MPADSLPATGNNSNDAWTVSNIGQLPNPHHHQTPSSQQVGLNSALHSAGSSTLGINTPEAAKSPPSHSVTSKTETSGHKSKTVQLERRTTGNPDCGDNASVNSSWHMLHEAAAVLSNSSIHPCSEDRSAPETSSAAVSPPLEIIFSSTHDPQTPGNLQNHQIVNRESGGLPLLAEVASSSNNTGGDLLATPPKEHNLPPPLLNTPTKMTLGGGSGGGGSGKKEGLEVRKDLGGSTMASGTNINVQNPNTDPTASTSGPGESSRGNLAVAVKSLPSTVSAKPAQQIFSGHQCKTCNLSFGSMYQVWTSV